jgi:hypothetical protein
LSASRAWPVPAAAGLNFVPQTATPAELEGAVAHASASPSSVAIVCVTHIEAYGVEASSRGVPVQDWLSRLRGIAKTPRLELTTFSRLSDLCDNRLDYRRLRRHKALSTLARCRFAFAGGDTARLHRAVYCLD